MQVRLTTILVLFSLNSFCQLPISFDTLKFDKVIMYDINPLSEGDPYVYDKYGRTNHEVLKEVDLDKSVITELSAKLKSKSSYGKTYASCFEPHLGLIFMYKERLATQMVICLKCNRLMSKAFIPAQLQGRQGEGDKTYYSLSGLSPSFRKYINTLLVKYQFSNQLNKNTDFDN